MRTIVCGTLACLVAACGAPAQEAARADGCARSAMHQITWTNEAAPDTISARSDGPSCAQAIVVLSIRNAKGDPLWTLASTHYDMTAGGGFPVDGAPAITDAQMDEFLTGWANVTTMRSGALPEWREGAARPNEGGEGLAYESPFDRETYEATRQRDLPLICYAAAAEASQCLMIDPASMSPGVLVYVSP